MVVLVWGMIKSLVRAKVPSMLGPQTHKIFGPVLLYQLYKGVFWNPSRNTHNPHPPDTYHCISLEHVFHLLANLQGALLPGSLLCQSVRHLQPILEGLWKGLAVWRTLRSR